MASQSTTRLLVRADVPRFSIFDLFAYLEGSWALSRHVKDHKGEVVADFSGIGWYRRSATGLFYGERGELCSEQSTDVAWRELHYEHLSPSRALVLFGDGNVFHDLDLSTGSWKVTHRCELDRYDGEFSAQTKDLLVVRWAMVGPTEHYVIETVATRRFIPDDYDRP